MSTQAVKQIRKRVNIGADGPNPVLIAKVFDVHGNEVSDPFAGVDYATLEILCNPKLVVDTRSNPSAVDFSMGQGVIELRLGDLTINPGVYLARLKTYDQLHESGQVVTHEKGPNQLWLEFV